MSRVLCACLITAVLWAVTPVSLAIPLSPSPAPESALGLSAHQWDESVSLILKEAVELLKRGERQQAKAKLAQFLKQYPNDPRGAELAGMILMEEKNYRVAAISFERALALNPNNPAALSKLGVALLLQDKKKEGEDSLKKAIALRPGEPLARRYLGWLEEGRGLRENAAHHYLAALNGGDLPKDSLTEIHLALGRVSNALGKYAQTIRLLAPYVSKTGPGEAGQVARFQLAYAYLDLKRGAEAAPLIQSLEKGLKPDNPELRFLKAYALRESDPASAREKLQSLIKTHPAYAGRARMVIARSYALEGKSALAAKELEVLAAQVVKGDLPEVLTALAAVQVSAGKAAEAASVLDTYARKHPDIPLLTYLVAEVRVQAGDAKGAQALLKQLISKYPNYAQAYFLLGYIERGQNALSPAEEHLRKAVTLDSNLTHAWLNLAGVYSSRKDSAKAEGAIKQGLETNPGDVLLQFGLAGIYDAMGKVEESNALYRAILAKFPDYVPALIHIALNLADQGTDLASARQYAEKAYQIDKRNPAVQDAYGWVLVLGNDIGKGLPMLEQAAHGLPGDPAVAYHLGAALIKAGKAEEGKRHVQRSLASGLPETLRKKAQSLVN